MHCSCTRYVCLVISLKLKIIELNLTIAILLKTILRARGLWPSGAEIGRDIFACSQLHTIRFLAIYMKTERFRALKLPCVPTNLTIAIILNPILRGLRPSGAEIALRGCGYARYGFSRFLWKRNGLELHNWLAYPLSWWLWSFWTPYWGVYDLQELI